MGKANILFCICFIHSVYELDYIRRPVHSSDFTFELSNIKGFIFIKFRIKVTPKKKSQEIRSQDRDGRCWYPRNEMSV